MVDSVQSGGHFAEPTEEVRDRNGSSDHRVVIGDDDVGGVGEQRLRNRIDNELEGSTRRDIVRCSGIPREDLEVHGSSGGAQRSHDQVAGGARPGDVDHQIGGRDRGVRRRGVDRDVVDRAIPVRDGRDRCGGETSRRGDHPIGVEREARGLVHLTHREVDVGGDGGSSVVDRDREGARAVAIQIRGDRDVSGFAGSGNDDVRVGDQILVGRDRFHHHGVRRSICVIEGEGKGDRDILEGDNIVGDSAENRGRPELELPSVDDAGVFELIVDRVQTPRIGRRLTDQVRKSVRERAPDIRVDIVGREIGRLVGTVRDQASGREGGGEGTGSFGIDGDVRAGENAVERHVAHQDDFLAGGSHQEQVDVRRVAVSQIGEDDRSLLDDTDELVGDAKGRRVGSRLGWDGFARDKLRIIDVDGAGLGYGETLTHGRQGSRQQGR
ncbi:MAG: hypothetical protein AB7O66_01480 [Limisphaerales bacterium]